MSDSTDPYDLQRFADAQQPVYMQVISELRAARKQSHWMWFIFPQISGLGHSAIARRYAIHSLAEAKAYVRHSLLGARLRECTQLINLVQDRSVEEILGTLDALKFRSSMTLFAQATEDNLVFRTGLEQFFASQPDPLTEELLERIPK